MMIARSRKELLGGGGICKDFIHTCRGREIRERKKREVLQSEFELAFGCLCPWQALFYVCNQFKISIIQILLLFKFPIVDYPIPNLYKLVVSCDVKNRF